MAESRLRDEWTPTPQPSTIRRSPSASPRPLISLSALAALLSFSSRPQIPASVPGYSCCQYCKLKETLHHVGYYEGISGAEYA